MIDIKILLKSKFVKLLRSNSSKLDDNKLRQLVFNYCKRYQEDYWFDQLENAFAYLEMTLNSSETNREELVSELPLIRDEVEEAIGEYFESLNEVAIAIDRLLNPNEMTIDDTITAIHHVWNAHACNEFLSQFTKREDTMLCQLLSSIA